LRCLRPGQGLVSLGFLAAKMKWPGLRETRPRKEKTTMKANRLVVAVAVLAAAAVFVTRPASARCPRMCWTAPGTSVLSPNAGEQQQGGSGGQSASGQSASAQAKKPSEEIEEAKKQYEKAQKMNALILQANTAVAAKNWQEALAPLKELTAMDATNWQIFSALGDAQLNLGQHEDAVATYKTGIAAMAGAPLDPQNPDAPKNRLGLAHMLTNQGNAYLKLKKSHEAVAAYTKAAELDRNPAVAYFNLCATQYNIGDVEGGLDACDRAIAADPKKADAYFIKGSLLIVNSTIDKNGKVTAVPGTAEALNKYLELAPEGPHASDVKQMLEYIGSKVETTYKPKKNP
jgi:tetratricopeptide (TPR) repeat protein